MEIVSCKECGKLFNFIRGQRVCPACSRKLEDKFMEVKKYVREHPNVDVKELSEEMDVSIRQINRWVREERLVFSDDSPVGLPCESCGVTIKTGRFCDKCKAELATGFRHAAGQDKRPAPQPAPRKSAADSRTPLTETELSRKSCLNIFLI